MKTLILLFIFGFGTLSYAADKVEKVDYQTFAVTDSNNVRTVYNYNKVNRVLHSRSNDKSRYIEYYEDEIARANADIEKYGAIKALAEGVGCNGKSADSPNIQ